MRQRAADYAVDMVQLRAYAVSDTIINK